MRPTPSSCLAFLGACLIAGCNRGTVDDTAGGGHAWDPESTLCGTVEIADTGCAEEPLPATVGVWTVRAGFSACVLDTAEGDWVDERVAQPEVDEDGFFEARVDPGDYGVAAYTDLCEDCRPVTVDGQGCTQVALVLHRPVEAGGFGTSFHRPGRLKEREARAPYLAAEASSEAPSRGAAGRETSSNQAR
ncbi:MAG: hypothetical protein JXB39_05280 [Deltaproteobacteria bacterium]|nr:hypothetical protein [Deltaproteobacteria bacterium]